MKCVKDEEPFVIKVPKGEPVKCHQDREGTITVYVVTEDDDDHHKTTTPSQAAVAPSSSDAARKKLLTDIFGSDDEDDVKQSERKNQQGEKATAPPSSLHHTQTYVTRNSTEVQHKHEEEEEEEEEREEDRERRELDGTCTVFQDPNTTLMDKTNISKLMSPFIATRVWSFPTRTYDMVHNWKPEEEEKKTFEQHADVLLPPASSSTSSTMSVSSPPGMMRSPTLPPSSPPPSSSSTSVPQPQKPREDLWCWHDCHPFKGRPFRLPWAYNSRSETYSVIGYFCSPACARAFNNSWDMCVSGRTKRDNLITDMAIRHYGYSFRNKSQPEQISVFPVAPDKLLLRQFGGPLTIEEFRKYTLPDCRLHVSLEFPYIIVPQIAVEHVVSDETGASQRRSIYNASKVHTQQADPLEVQAHSDDIADCCKQNRCRKRTFAEATMRKKKKKEEEQQESQDKKPVTSFGQQRPGEEVSVLDQVKRAVWNEKRKKMYQPTRPKRSTKESQRRVEEEEETAAESHTRKEGGRHGRHRHKKKTVIAQSADARIAESPPHKKRKGSTPSSSSTREDRPTPQARQQQQQQQQQQPQRGYKMLKDILLAACT